MECFGSRFKSAHKYCFRVVDIFYQHRSSSNLDSITRKTGLWNYCQHRRDCDLHPNDRRSTANPFGPLEPTDPFHNRGHNGGSRKCALSDLWFRTWPPRWLDDRFALPNRAARRTRPAIYRGRGFDARLVPGWSSRDRNCSICALHRLFGRFLVRNRGASYRPLSKSTGRLMASSLGVASRYFARGRKHPRYQNSKEG